ncbi:MAG: OmpA family protein [Gammaproteobacteria bacterium]|nr:OmpA family protein [Gammaproteobacteria bacterium]
MAFGAATSCAIAEEHRSWYIAPALNYVIADDDRSADDDFGFQIGIGREIGQRWNLELNLEADNLDIEDGAGAFQQRGVSLNGLYFFSRERAFAPYALIGAGALHNRLPGDNATNLMANAGVGFLTSAGSKMSLRGEARYRWDTDNDTIPSEDDGFGDWVVSLGLHIPFGRSSAAPEPAPAPAPVAAPVVEPEPTPVVADSDGDGVPDDRDECPGTRAGAAVDSRGCEPDGDGDGVPNADDRCPNTPAGAKVDAFGCEFDSDGDGVVDRLDRCPDTAAGVRVDVRGCEIKEVISLQGVNFETSSARLIGDSTATLDETAETLLKHPDITAEVGGHSDITGPRDFNLRLSQQRAESVRDYLISKGVAADRLTAVGYGPDRPVADNATPEGRAANRRVELQLNK